MSAPPRRGIAPLAVSAVSAVSLLCGLAAAPAHAAPASITPPATPVTPAHAIPTVPVRTILTPTSTTTHATPALPPPPLPDDRTGDHLTLVVHGAGPGRDGVRQLFCHPEAGDHPDPAGACRVLDENTRWGRDTFAPVPPDSICTMIDGGPATAHVTGHLAGRPVDAEFSRRNGCEIDRWDRLVPFLPGARS
ncbi:SSI family serine proteinase inhibitor [Streptomyces seoulensis]|uniref:SSI family serine proteinase inhibitor n=1 Tax=Streptomyces seoulensis TaxID=73044 RepID=UPI00339E2166